MGFWAVFLVLITLLSQSIFSSYNQQKTRPKIISCLIFEGDDQKLIEQIKEQSPYIDQFVVFSSLQDGALSKASKHTLKQQYSSRIRFFSADLPLNRLTLEQGFIEEAFSCHVFDHLKRKDLLLFFREDEKIDFPKFLRSLSVANYDLKKTFQVDSLYHNQPSYITGGAFSSLQKNQDLLKDIKTQQSKHLVKKRLFFFQAVPFKKENKI